MSEENNKLEITKLGKQKFFEKPTIKINLAIQKLIDYVIDESDIIIPIIVIGSLVTFTIYQIYAAINQQNPTENITMYIYLTCIPIVIMFSYILYISFDNKTKYMFYLFSVFGLIVFLIVYGFVITSNFKFNMTLQSLFSYIFVGAIVIFGLTIFYNIFENQLRTTDTWGSFLIEFIFYIPCIMEKFVKYMIKDYTKTSNSTIILLMTEIILILIYFYIYPAYKKSIYDNSVVLLKKPVFLNYVTSRLIQPMKDVYADKIQPPINNILSILEQQFPSTYPYRVNYAISMWVYVNPMPMSRMGYAKETNIFSYGTENKTYATNEVNLWEIKTPTKSAPTKSAPTKSAPTTSTPTTSTPGPTKSAPTTSTPTTSTPGPTTSTPTNSTPTKHVRYRNTNEYHPKISLVEENNNYLFNFYYSGSDKNKPTHQLELPLQKWNNIVLNYVNNGVDVFINGELSLSYNFRDDIPIYSDDDDIFVGDTNEIAYTNTNGLYGSICNIAYYMTPLTKREIVLNYNMLSINNPPL